MVVGPGVEASLPVGPAVAGEQAAEQQSSQEARRPALRRPERRAHCVRAGGRLRVDDEVVAGIHDGQLAAGRRRRRRRRHEAKEAQSVVRVDRVVVGGFLEALPGGHGTDRRRVPERTDARDRTQQGERQDGDRPHRGQTEDRQQSAAPGRRLGGEGAAADLEPGTGRCGVAVDPSRDRALELEDELAVETNRVTAFEAHLEVIEVRRGAGVELAEAEEVDDLLGNALAAHRSGPSGASPGWRGKGVRRSTGSRTRSARSA